MAPTRPCRDGSAAGSHLQCEEGGKVLSGESSVEPKTGVDSSALHWADLTTAYQGGGLLFSGNLETIQPNLNSATLTASTTAEIERETVKVRLTRVSRKETHTHTHATPSREQRGGGKQSRAQRGLAGGRESTYRDVHGLYIQR